MQLSEFIKLSRQKAFLSQAESSRKIGVSVSSIIRWESGKGVPNLAAMKKLITFCDENDLLYEILERARFGETLPKRNSKM